MIAYLDANVVIYFVEKNPVWWPKVSARINTLQAGGDEIAVSDVARLECLVGPYMSGNTDLLSDYTGFFSDPAIRVFPASTAVFERAAQIRATFSFKPLDALHLAAAVEHGCGLFLSNDAQLGRFTGIQVEVLS
jgi:uncharacterized protein